MGRMVSCSTCGAWHEVQPNESPQGWVCPACRGKGAGRQASPDVGGVASSGSIGGDAASTIGSTSAIGRDSGQIGSPNLSGSLERQLSEMHSAVEHIQIGTADLAEVEQRLARSAEATQAEAEKRVTQWASPADYGPAAPQERIADVERIVADWAPGQTPQIGQAARAVADAARKTGQAAQAKAVRVTRQARRVAAQHLDQAADRAEQVVRQVGEAADKTAPRIVKRAIPQTETACPLCGDRIVLGDRVTTCPDCGAHYHADCYNLMGGCMSVSCREKAGERGNPYRLAEMAQQAALAKVQKAGTAEVTRRCTSCGASVTDRALVCPKCGQWLSRRSRRPSGAASNQEEFKLPAGCMVAIVFFVFFIIIMIASRH